MHSQLWIQYTYIDINLIQNIYPYLEIIKSIKVLPLGEAAKNYPNKENLSLLDTIVMDLEDPDNDDNYFFYYLWTNESWNELNPIMKHFK